MTPQVTVCLPTFNGSATIEAALASAAAQRFDDFEILVVDDGSTDDTVQRAMAFGDATTVAFRLERNPAQLGLAGNWNRCLELADGQWVKFLFQDDLLHPRCLEEMLGAIGSHDLVVCHRRPDYSSASRSHRRAYASYLRSFSLRRLLGRSQDLSADEACALLQRAPFVNFLGEPVSHLVRRSAALRRPYDDQLVHLLDFELAARLATQGGFTYIDRALATFRVHDLAATAANYRDRRFVVEEVEPARLAARYITDPAFANLRAWAAARSFDLETIAVARVAQAVQRLDVDSSTDRAAWDLAVATEPGLDDLWAAARSRDGLDRPRGALRTWGSRLRVWARISAAGVGRLGRRARGRG